MYSEWISWVLAVVLACVGAAALLLGTRRSERQQLEAERERLQRLVLPGGVQVGPYARRDGTEVRPHQRRRKSKFWSRSKDTADEEVSADDERTEELKGFSDEEIPSTSTRVTVTNYFNGTAEEVLQGTAEEVREHENTRFILLLIDYYAHGLIQARRNSMASLVSAGVGITIVIAGAAFAIFSARSGTGVTAAIVVSISGALTNAIGVLFHRQANRALTHLEGQTQNLREDMRTDRETRKAINLISDVDDPELRNRLRAGVILQLAQAKLAPETS